MISSRFGSKASRRQKANTANEASYVTFQGLQSYSFYYLQYNYHGNLVTTVKANNGNGGQRGWYNPWGANEGSVREYYRWNGQWGYLWFNDLKLYYAHGRWWRPDIGIFLSPSEDSGE